MFYPCSIDLKNLSKVKQGIVVLTPAESKRLLAKAVAALPEVQWAYANGKLAVTSGTTDSFVVEELTGEKIEPYRFCVGMSAVGMLTMSAQEDRVLGRFYDKGQRVDTPYPELINSLGKGDVIIKGANAVDPSGNAGVLLSNDAGGLVGAMFGVASARGIPVISPVGLEKQIVSVPDAAAGWGQLTLDYAMGVPVGMSSLTSLLVVTEIQALAIMAGIHARLLACGGIGGNEGAVVLLLEGDSDSLDKALRIIQSVKGEPKIEVPRHYLS
jgi:hypothetical protein